MRIERHRVRALDPSVAGGQRRVARRRSRRRRRRRGARGLPPAQSPAIWSRGSIAPVLTVPALAATQKGRRRRRDPGATACAERRDVHPEVAVDRDGGSPPSCPSPRISAAFRMQLWPSSDRYRTRGGALAGALPRATSQPSPVGGAVARGGQAVSDAIEPAADEEPHAALDRKADQLHQPSNGGALEVDRRVVSAGAARVRAPRPGNRPRSPMGAGRRVHPAEEARVAVAHRVREDVALDAVEKRLGRDPARPGGRCSRSVARSAGVIGAKTGRSRMPARWSATRSTAR